MCSVQLKGQYKDTQDHSHKMGEYTLFYSWRHSACLDNNITKRKYRSLIVILVTHILGPHSAVKGEQNEETTKENPSDLFLARAFRKNHRLVSITDAENIKQKGKDRLHSS